MIKLNPEQANLIRKDLERRSLNKSFLFYEYLDHICCDVENLMNTGMSFQDAWSSVQKEPAENQIKQAHSRTISLLNHRYVLAKKILILAVLLFAVSWLIWVPAAARWTGLVSFLLLSGVYFKISIDFYKERGRHRSGMLMSLLAMLSFLGTLSGIILIFLQRTLDVNTAGHGVDLTVFAWFLFSILCLIYYARQTANSIEVQARKRNSFLSWISAVNLFMASVSIATFPLFTLVGDYVYYLIILILIFDVSVLLIFLIGKYLKNTLAVSLILGSFMIVFIHSHFRQMLPGGNPKMHSINVKINAENSPADTKLYFYMYFDKYSEHKFVLPMRQYVMGSYGNSIPSYAYKGYLVYTIRTDSVNAGYAFRQEGILLDSLELSIPKIKDYVINYK